MSNKWSSTHNGERSSLKEFISQSQAVWRNLQLGAPLCIAGGDKGMPSVPEIWSSSLLWCGMRIRSCAETQTHDSRVIDCFAADTSADRPHCFYSLLRFLSPPNNNHFRLSSVHVQLLFQDDWLWWTINRIIACVNTSGCLVRGTEGRIERCLTDTSMVRRVPTIRWFIWSCSNPSRCQLSVMTNRWGQLSVNNSPLIGSQSMNHNKQAELQAELICSRTVGSLFSMACGWWTLGSLFQECRMLWYNSRFRMEFTPDAGAKLAKKDAPLIPAAGDAWR